MSLLLFSLITEAETEAETELVHAELGPEAWYFWQSL